MSRNFLILFGIFLNAQFLLCASIWGSPLLAMKLPPPEIMELYNRINEVSLTAGKELDTASAKFNNEIKKVQMDMKLEFKNFELELKSATKVCATAARKAHKLTVKEFDSIKQCSKKADVKTIKKNFKNSLSVLKKQIFTIDYYCTAMNEPASEEYTTCINENAVIINQKIDEAVAKVPSLDEITEQSAECISISVNKANDDMAANKNDLNLCMNPTTVGPTTDAPTTINIPTTTLETTIAEEIITVLKDIANNENDDNSEENDENPIDNEEQVVENALNEKKWPNNENEENENQSVNVDENDDNQAPEAEKSAVDDLIE